MFLLMMIVLVLSFKVERQCTLIEISRSHCSFCGLDVKEYLVPRLFGLMSVRG